MGKPNLHVPCRQFGTGRALVSTLLLQILTVPTLVFRVTIKFGHYELHSKELLSTCDIATFMFSVIMDKFHQVYQYQRRYIIINIPCDFGKPSDLLTPFLQL